MMSPGLSPSELLSSPGFFSPPSPYGMSHQQAWAQVTAQAAFAQSQMPLQVEYPGTNKGTWRAWGKPVLDRVGLIIEIFNAHAKTKEGKLQAELATLMHMKTRFVCVRGLDGRYTFGVDGQAEVVSARGISERRKIQIEEVDAALDLSHTQNIGRMIKAYSQFIVVSSKKGMFNNANVLFWTKFVDGVSTVQRTVASKQNK